MRELTEGDVQNEKRVSVGNVWGTRTSEVRHFCFAEKKREREIEIRD